MRPELFLSQQDVPFPGEESLTGAASASLSVSPEHSTGSGGLGGLPIREISRRRDLKGTKQPPLNAGHQLSTGVV